MSHFQQDFIKVVIEIYGLETDDREIDDVLSAWMRQYDSAWIFKAIVESLYRGRYKIVCVENILSNWQRLGNPRYQFTPEYEREILAQIPEIANRSNTVHGNPLIIPTTDSPDLESADSPAKIDIPVRYHLPKKIDCEDLNPEESAPFQSPHLPRSTVRYSPNSSDPIDPSADPAPTQSVDVSTESLPHKYLASVSLPPVPQHQYRNNLSPDRHISKPVNRKLFNTLTAIVAPNHQHKLKYDNNNLPLLRDSHISNIARFKSLEHANEQQL